VPVPGAGGAGHGMTARVAVAIPCHNDGATLPEAVQSIRRETEAVELVVVDDGSTEARTRTLLDEATRRPGVTVHRTENRGPALARNLAIERARGAYILPLDADDWLEPAFLAKTVALLDADPGLGVAYTWVGLAGAHHGVWRTGGFTVGELLARCTIHVASLFRRSLWADVGGYDPAFVESSEDWARACPRCSSTTGGATRAASGTPAGPARARASCVRSCASTARSTRPTSRTRSSPCTRSAQPSA
jgi:glycosyltransferase involved in cell wall biosynthesis